METVCTANKTLRLQRAYGYNYRILFTKYSENYFKYGPYNCRKYSEKDTNSFTKYSDTAVKSKVENEKKEKDNMKRLTPAKAIKDHCRLFCMNGYDNCNSEECVLKLTMSSLKKIKAFCSECAPDFKPQDCEGIVLNTEETRNYSKCPLWVFRFGKNPYLKGNPKPDQRHLIPFKKSPIG